MKRYKTYLVSLVTCLLVLVVAIESACASVPVSFKFVGSGHGHGVGFSQMGAKGQALAGKSAIEIVKYYFPQAEVTPVPDTQLIRVNTAHQINSVKFSVTNEQPNIPAGINLTDMAVPNAATNLINNSIQFMISGNQIIATSNGVTIGTSNLWSMTLSSPNSYFVQNVSGTVTKLKYGTIQLRGVAVKGKGFLIEVTDTMRLHDEYLYGIGEVPSIWPSAAIQAQIIASRTFALSRMDKIRPDCDCHIYSHKYDQVYGGYYKELDPKYGAKWRAAVDATATDAQNGLAITINGVPINIYFFASSGGNTQRAIDVWGRDIPYLDSVPDPWSLDKKVNPKYAKWVRVVPQDVMAKAFKLPNVFRYQIDSRTKTGSVLNITAYSTTGEKATLPVGIFKTAVKLPSSWFDLPPRN